MDYCFLVDEFDRLTVLVVIHRYTKMKEAVVVPTKGSTGSCAAGIVISRSSTGAGQGTRTSS